MLRLLLALGVVAAMDSGALAQSAPDGEPAAPAAKPDAPAPAAKSDPVAPAAKPKPSAKLYIETRPTGARLSVDAEDVGVAPWTGPVLPGQHTITATLAGYLPLVQEVSVGAGEGRHMMLDLVRDKPAGKRFYQRWQFWAGTSVAAVGAGVLLYVLLRPSYDVRIDYP